MNDFDEEKIDRLVCDQSFSMTPYEKVLEEKERRNRWKAYQANKVQETFDWFIRDSMGEFYNYDPRNDD